MDSNDSEIIIPETSSSEDETDLSGNIHLNTAHSTQIMRPSHFPSSSESDVEIVHKPAQTRHRALSSSDEVSISDEDTSPSKTAPVNMDGASAIIESVCSVKGTVADGESVGKICGKDCASSKLQMTVADPEPSPSFQEDASSSSKENCQHSSTYRNVENIAISSEEDEEDRYTIEDSASPVNIETIDIEDSAVEIVNAVKNVQIGNKIEEAECSPQDKERLTLPFEKQSSALEAKKSSLDEIQEGQRIPAGNNEFKSSPPKEIELPTYDQLVFEISGLQRDVAKLKNTLANADIMSKLPDQGMKFRKKLSECETLLRIRQKELSQNAYVKNSAVDKNEISMPPKDVKEIKPEEANNVKSSPKEEAHLPTLVQLQSEISNLEKDVIKLRGTLMSVDVSKLPDQGMRLQMKLKESEKLLKLKQKALSEKAYVDNVEVNTARTVVKPPTHRLPIGFGMQAIQTQIREKTLTEEALHRLHGSINSCPAENVLAEDPHNLKSKLMTHQKHAVAWMMWRETQRPRAGILADDMGLGKTLTMISLILKEKQDEKDQSDTSSESEEDSNDANHWLSKKKKSLPQGGTLVVCPASLLMQWEDEIKKHCRRSALNVEIHHGTGREDNARRLAKNDVVLTTYSIVRNSGGKEESSQRGVLHQINWNRIILDEAHTVRNHKSQQSLSVCSLRSKKRWALTGTPVHNKELDLYALLKFLRVTPFDDYNVWRRWVDSKNSAGLQRLNTVIHAIMLRRTKEVLQAKGELESLPQKSFIEFNVKLDEEENKVYTKVLVYSKTLFAQYLHQRSEKENMMNPLFIARPNSKNAQIDENLLKSHPELANMFKKYHEGPDIKTHQILVLLLRLRQICCHPGLIKGMLDDEMKETDGIEDQDGLDIDLLSQFGGMSLKESPSET